MGPKLIRSMLTLMATALAVGMVVGCGTPADPKDEAAKAAQSKAGNKPKLPADEGN